jgi:type IX secretion system PorP/SprF family membrane protein
MSKKVRFLFILILGTCALNLSAQDPHFSFFSGVPIGLNPAYTGNFNGNFRVGAQYRDQWNSILSSEAIGAYRTAIGSVEARTNRGLDENDFVGGGAYVMYDVAGESRFKNTKFALSGSYRKALDEYGDHFLAIGAQFGIVQKTLDFERLKWGTQWDGTKYDNTLPSGELANLDNNISFYDLGAGISWGYNIYGTRNRFHAGLAFMHINRPNESFFTNNGSLNSTLPMKINFNAGAGLQISERMDVIPKMLFMQQGKNTEMMIGTDVRFLLDPEDPMGNSFYIGAMGRIVGGDKNLINSSSLNFESMIATARYEYNNFEIGAAYDFNVSQLVAASNYQGGFEVYFNYVFRVESNRQRKLFCPKF